MPNMTPCLWFDSEGEQAANFYVSVFPNSKILDIALYGDEGMRPANSVMTVSFELDGHPFLALNGGPEFTFTPAVSFQVHCTSQEEVDWYWTKLTEGGEESRCGWLDDRFGLSWQIVPDRLVELLGDPDKDKAARVMKSMMGMVKIDIAELERAAAAS
jgi:predicted 3-demethylubiquinone-9 3-methyltransferase (glyoxalase superfamily)